jgi:ABC-type lipoprotein release transport system permease subunit
MGKPVTSIPLLLLVTAGLASLLPAEDAARSEPVATLGAG